jgi:2-dehydropantoate 2-reductase
LATRGDVLLVARPATATAIAAAGGIRLEGLRAGVHPVCVTTRLVIPPGAQVVVAVKAYDLDRLLAALRPHLDADSRVVLMQNGLGVAARARQILHRDVERAITELAATRLAPGRVRWVTAGPTLFPPGTGLEKMWTAAGLPARAVADLRPHLWRKVAVNAVINPLTALLEVENGALLSLRHAPRAILAEIVQVAAAYGQPMHLSSTLASVRRSMQRTARNTSSMLQDVRAGRATEIDWLNGALARLGEARGVPAPCNAALAELVRERAARGAAARPGGARPRG